MAIAVGLLNFLLLSFMIQASRSIWLPQGDPPDTAQRVRDKGYFSEKHEVTTEDGYILTVYRIPYGKNSRRSSLPRPQVILQHGLLCSSDSWIISEPSNGLAYLLADNGFDVWLPNSRGTTYSKKHTNLSSDNDEYWDFSFHEMGVYDLPAVIDYILLQSGRNKLSYIGHSQGSAIFFIMASLRPEYGGKINVACAMAPVAGLENVNGVVSAMVRVSEHLEVMADFFNVKYTLERSTSYEIMNAVCSLPITGNLCKDLLHAIAGLYSPNLDGDIIPLVPEISPSGCSIKQLKHFAQWARNLGKFSLYDYGTGNMQHYNATEPPEYPLSTITTPVVIFYSCTDFVTSCNITKRLEKDIRGPVFLYEVKEFNHADFLWATNAKQVLYPDIIRVLKEYN